MSLDAIHQQLADLSAELTKLRDMEEIRQVMYAYARGVDRADQALIAPTFHDDAFDDHGNFKGDKANTLAALNASSKNPATTASFHHLGNILIDLQGDEAKVESYFMAVQRKEENGKTYTRSRAGRYLDHFVKEKGAWQVMHRKVVDDWSRLDEVLQTAREVGPDNYHATRTPEDPSYSLEGFVAFRKGYCAE